MPRESVPLDDVIRSMMNHVIHNHWLRQEVSKGRIKIMYTSSVKIMVNKFIKALLSDKFKKNYGIIKANPL